MGYSSNTKFAHTRHYLTQRAFDASLSGNDALARFYLRALATVMARSHGAVR